MAALIGAGVAAAALPSLEEIAAFLLGTGATSTLARTGLGIIGGIAAGDLIKVFEQQPQTKTTSKGAALRYAIVDMHNNTIVRPLSRQATYKLLTRRRRRSRAHSPKVAVVPAGSELVTIR